MKVHIPAACAKRSRNSRIVCDENRRKLTFINSAGHEVIKYSIDGCSLLRDLLQDPSCKLCDFLVVVESLCEEHYVELKGRRVEHALHQIESTILQLSLLSPATSVQCWIVATESPRESSKFQVLRRKLEKKFKARVKIRVNIRTAQCEHILNGH
jgi:hypothetical protein